ncbi:hypothetical protein BSY88_14855 [Enterococcus faecium]|nr:hypothetical protein BSY88_14855 [Enterococcus faecium]
MKNYDPNIRLGTHTIKVSFLNHRYRKGFYSLFKTLQQNHPHYAITFISMIRVCFSVLFSE